MERTAMYARIICLIVLALFAAGCNRETKSPEVARVGRHILGQDELQARAEMIAALMAHRSGNTNDCERIRQAFCTGYARFWAEDRVLADFAAANGIKLTEEQLERHRQAAFRNFRTRSDRDYRSLVAAVIRTPELWEDQVRSEALRTVMTEYWLKTDPPQLPEGYAAAKIAEMEAWNANLPATNAWVYARATNAWQRIRSGEDFVKVAKETTDLREEVADDCQYGVMDAKMLEEDPKLLAALQRMKPGEVSAPVEGDGGLMVVRLDALAQDNGYEVSRIFFRLGQKVIPASKEDIEAHARSTQKQELFDRKVKELLRAAGYQFEQDDDNN